MGVMQGGMTAGGVLGPLFGGLLADQFGMRMAFFIAAAALFLITLALFFFVKEEPRKPDPNRSRFGTFLCARFRPLSAC